jgi:hypothetical protein
MEFLLREQGCVVPDFIEPHVLLRRFLHETEKSPGESSRRERGATALQRMDPDYFTMKVAVVELLTEPEVPVKVRV